MCAFSKQLEYDNSKIQKLHQICLYNTLIFVKVWLNVQNTADAPLNYLKLCEPLNIYEKYEPGVAITAILTSSNLWYLTEEAVAFSLFSKKVADSEKKKIVASLMKYKANEKSLPTDIPVLPV
ncbi:hypothetical protein AVEN_146855-1 [Araneus ventricosus]|uniref:Uncharacterized protein n=1 Tax=Araneus ventricosus TaxID=182803 RepID=A0A4Y2NXI3_ARAVE|nr:hypothetical protein AVEN_146855-1 [Araneus ventricosus]